MTDGTQGAAAPGQAARPEPCEHHWVSQHKPGHRVYWVRLCGFCGDPDWDDLDKEIAGAIAAAQERPAPGALESAYLYHCKFKGLGGDEYGLFWRKADADAAAAKRAGEGYTEVLGMAILGDRPAAPAGERPAPGELADWWVCDGPLPDGKKILGPFGSQELALSVRSHTGQPGLWVDDEPAGERPGAELVPVAEARAELERVALECDQARAEQEQTAAELTRVKNLLDEATHLTIDPKRFGRETRAHEIRAEASLPIIDRHSGQAAP